MGDEAQARAIDHPACPSSTPPPDVTVLFVVGALSTRSARDINGGGDDSCLERDQKGDVARDARQLAKKALRSEDVLEHICKISQIEGSILEGKGGPFGSCHGVPTPAARDPGDDPRIVDTD